MIGLHGDDVRTQLARLARKRAGLDAERLGSVAGRDRNGGIGSPAEDSTVAAHRSFNPSCGRNGSGLHRSSVPNSEVVASFDHLVSTAGCCARAAIGPPVRYPSSTSGNELRNRVRTRLAGGGRWIRTSRSAREEIRKSRYPRWSSTDLVYGTVARISAEPSGRQPPTPDVTAGTFV
jgi:hypothetical protein